MNSKFKKTVAGVMSATMLATSATVVAPTTVSAETTINYGDALALSLYFYDGQQCGTEVDENCLTWRGNCHTYDATASLNDAQGLTATEKAVIKEANGGSDTVDVSGGFHDAGDHLKFTMTMAYSSTNLAWAYYQYPQAFEETGSKDHLFDILKEMCDYFMKVTYLDDNDDVVTFCYMVGGDQDHNEWSSPETQTMNRPTYWATKSKNSTDTACQMAAALASASMALKEVDADYANECLKYANALQEFGSTYVNATYDGVGSYYSSGSQKDDIAWGDLWCHLANGTISSYSPIVPQDGVYNGEYDYWVYSWDKLWGGYSTLLSQLGFGTSFTNEVKFEMDKLNTNYSQAYYPIGGGWGASRYNCAWQMYAMEYADATGNDQYYTYAKSQMDYLLGDNPQGRSYLIGYSDTYPVNIHHRAANPNKSSATYTLYGALVGGPTDANGSYDDSTDSYSCTEPALDYNGSFIMAIAGLYNKYGDGTDEINDIISSASEIDENYTFGTWYEGGNTTVTQPEETTTTTEEVTTTEEITTTTEEVTTPPTTTTEVTTTMTATMTTTTVYDNYKVVDYTGEITKVYDNEAGFELTTDDGQTIYISNSSAFTQKLDLSEFKVGDKVDITGLDIGSGVVVVALTSIKLADGDVTTTTEKVTTTEPSGGATGNTLLGDVNLDGNIRVNDIQVVRQWLLHSVATPESTDQAFINADANLDGTVRVNDIQKVRQYVLHIINEI